MRRIIASGALDEHFAGNAQRAPRAARLGVDARAALRASGVAMPGPASTTPREVIEAIVVAIEGGAKVATAVKASSISYSTFHVGLVRHPDLKARMPRR